MAASTPAHSPCTFEEACFGRQHESKEQLLGQRSDGAFLPEFKDGTRLAENYANQAEAMNDIADYIDIFYNSQRLHSKLGNLPPPMLSRKNRQ